MRALRSAAALLLVALVAIGAAVAAPAASASARGASVLRLPDAHVALSGANLRGWFVVRNVGGRGSGPLRATVSLRREETTVAVGPLAPGASLRVSVALPAPAAQGRPQAVPRVCLRQGRAEGDCRGLGAVQLEAAAPTSGPPTGTGSPGAAPGVPTSSVPTNPIPFTKGEVFELHDPASEYWVYVPQSYDSTHRTPTTLFVWLHGCGGEGRWDIYNVSPGGAQDWISIAVGGEEGGCWDPAGDQAKVLAAIADTKTHFNIAPKRVVLGGYSSGGDLAYRTAYEHASQFAGILVENTTPFRDTGLTANQAIADASWKFHVVQLAHLQDTTYPIGTVREETGTLAAAGFPLALVERNGTHYDEPNAKVAGERVPGTDADVATYLLPHLDDGWTAP